MRKDETASPTVGTDCVFITAFIEAAENRRTAVVDLPGAYLSAEMDDEEEVLMGLRGDLANMMSLAASKVSSSRVNRQIHSASHIWYVPPVRGTSVDLRKIF
jgi:hypothetical protein